MKTGGGGVTDYYDNGGRQNYGGIIPRRRTVIQLLPRSYRSKLNGAGTEFLVLVAGPFSMLKIAVLLLVRNICITLR
jgi:hypothetical protein